jgi:hypothetical protein
MVAVDVAVTNSGEVVRSDVQNRERWGGAEMGEEKNQFTAELLSTLWRAARLFPSSPRRRRSRCCGGVGS